MTLFATRIAVLISGAESTLHTDEIFIQISLNQGEAQAKAWGCDLTYDYIKINGDYRT